MLAKFCSLSSLFRVAEESTISGHPAAIGAFNTEKINCGL
jgi:hypothetical protein